MTSQSLEKLNLQYSQPDRLTGLATFHIRIRPLQSVSVLWKFSIAETEGDKIPSTDFQLDVCLLPQRLGNPEISPCRWRLL